MEKQKLLTQNRITVIDALRGFALLGPLEWFWRTAT